MEKITDLLKDQDGNYDYGIDGEGIAEAFLVFAVIVLLGAVFSGMIICGCCIGGVYTINKYCLQPNNNSDPNTTYTDVPLELKVVSDTFDTKEGKELNVVEDVEITGKTVD